MKLKNLLAISMSAVLAMTALTACGSKDDSSEAASESASSSKKTAKVIEIDLTDEQYAFGVDKDQPELLTQVNDFIKSMNEDGSFEEICNHYFGDGEPVACGRNHFGGRGIYKLRKRCNGMDVSEYADADIRWRSRQDVHQGHIR